MFVTFCFVSRGPREHHLSRNAYLILDNDRAHSDDGGAQENGRKEWSKPDSADQLFLDESAAGGEPGDRG
jgi:hypothetical protein